MFPVTVIVPLKVITAGHLPLDTTGEAVSVDTTLLTVDCAKDAPDNPAAANIATAMPSFLLMTCSL